MNDHNFFGGRYNTDASVFFGGWFESGLTVFEIEIPSAFGFVSRTLKYVSSSIVQHKKGSRFTDQSKSSISAKVLQDKSSGAITQQSHEIKDLTRMDISTNQTLENDLQKDASVRKSDRKNLKGQKTNDNVSTVKNKKDGKSVVNNDP